MPMSWQARMMRTAISPRLAIRIFLNMLVPAGGTEYCIAGREVEHGAEAPHFPALNAALKGRSSTFHFQRGPYRSSFTFHKKAALVGRRTAEGGCPYTINGLYFDWSTVMPPPWLCAAFSALIFFTRRVSSTQW